MRKKSQYQPPHTITVAIVNLVAAISETVGRLSTLTHTAKSSAVSTDQVGDQATDQVALLLNENGQPIDNNDLWIAAHAKAADVAIVTNRDALIYLSPGGANFEDQPVLN